MLPSCIPINVLGDPKAKPRLWRLIVDRVRRDKLCGNDRNQVSLTGIVVNGVANFEQRSWMNLNPCIDERKVVVDEIETGPGLESRESQNRKLYRRVCMNTVVGISAADRELA